MQSIKNTTVSIVLLFLSYGVYQVITKPLPSELDSNMLGALEVIDSNTRSENPMIADLEMPTSDKLLNDMQEAIPPQLLELELPKSDMINPGPRSSANEMDDNNGFGSQFFTKTSDIEPPANPNIPAAPSQADFQSQSQPSFSRKSLPDNSANHQTVSLDSQPETIDDAVSSDRHFDSDSQIMPSTVMGAVSQKPGPTDSNSGGIQETPRTLTDTWPMINELVETSRFQEALTELSSFYRTGNVQSHEQEQLLEWLDALAAKVIYSSEHHLRSMPYIIQPGDTIGSLARQWQVPAQLIYNINSSKIPDPNDLTPAVEIKLVQGPFDAEIDSQAGLMTLYLSDMYAGRFTIQPGQAVAPGDFRIVDKSAQDHLDRPFWIALNNGGSIYAAENDPHQSNEIGMNLREAEELFSILSASSKVRVLR